MRLSNRSRKPLYSFIYSLVGIIFILGLIGFVLEINKFDVLGKKVLQTQLSSRELNVSSLSPGVYIIKINENQATATRKLIIR